MFNIAAIVGIIVGVCNATNYFNTDDSITKLDVEKKIMREMESKQRIVLRDLSQRDMFMNIVRNSNHMTEQELKDELERILQQ